MLHRLRTRQGRDALLTLATEGLAMLGMVYAYRLAAQAGDEELGLYVIARRTVSFGFPVLLLGATIGLTRYVAMTSVADVRRRYLASALTWVLPLGALTMALGAFLSAPLSWTLFGDAEHAALVPPLALMIVGIGLHGVAYAQLRGAGEGAWANLIQLTALALAPCIAFFLFDRLEQVLWATAIAWTAASLLVIVGLLAGRMPRTIGRERAELLRYGLPRVPGDVAMGALLTVPVYVAARTHGLSVGGQVGFGATLLNLAAAVFNPVALLLLPAASARLAAGDHAGLSRNIARLSRIMLLASAALMVGFEMLAGPLLRLYIGPTADQHLLMSRLCFLGALPFGYFFGMRSVLDAYFHTPRNGVNLLKAFGILMLGAFIHLLIPTPPYTMGIVMVIAMWWLGWATWRDTRFVRSELDRLAAARGGGLRIVLITAPAKEEGPLVAALADAGRNTVTHLPLGWGSLNERNRMKRVLRAARPDVVYVRHHSRAALLTVLNCPVPVVMDLHLHEDLKWYRQLVPQLAAFFATGIVCRDEAARDLLWWRAEDARVIVKGGKGENDETFSALRAAALHAPN